MGTTVQYKSYSPAFYPMWDLNEGADTNWSGYYEDKTFGGHLYNGFALRRTMLEHEATFRKQVYELHRLYRIQKDLMDEFEKKGLCSYSVLADTSQSSSFSSQIASKCTERIWLMHDLPVVTASYNMTPVASNDDMRLPLNFLKQNDSELSFRSVAPINEIYAADRENDVKLTLGTGECPSLANLNEPIGEICHELAVRSTSTHCLGLRTHREESQGHHLPMKLTLGSCSNFPYAVKEQVRQKWPFYYNKAAINLTAERSSVNFFSSDLHNEKLSMSPEPIQLAPKKNQEILFSNKTDMRLKQIPTLDIEISERSQLLASSNNSGPAVPGTPRSFSVDPNFDYTCIEISERSQLDSNFGVFGKSNLDSKGKTSAFGNYGSHGHQKCSKGSDCADVDLNQAVLNGIGDGLTALQDPKFSTLEGKCNESVDLNKIASPMELGFSHCNPQLMSSSYPVNPGLEWKQEKEKGEEILGFPILDKIQKNDICSPSHQEQSVTDDMKASSFEKQNHIGRPIQTTSTKFSNHINLNSTSMDTTEMSPEGEAGVQPQLSVSSFATKVGSKIDLEAQPENSHRGALVREAAETIVLMSLDNCSHFDVIPSRSLSPDPCNTLKWFAAIVVSGGVVGSESVDDGLDLFELMTLNLEIMKSDEFYYRPRELEDYVEEEKGTASRRRRRQHRDFQKDILPGLASLSRHEVAKDLQTIGAPMRASGWSRKTSLAKSTNVESQVEGRAVIGWGRTTRRGRRPRWPPNLKLKSARIFV